MVLNGQYQNTAHKGAKLQCCSVDSADFNDSADFADFNDSADFADFADYADALMLLTF